MIFQADAAFIPLEDRSVHCVVTSPPYWGLRKYHGQQGLGLFPHLGQEPTFEEHIERMVVILREIGRVLRDDGTVLLDYGDTLATPSPGSRGTRSFGVDGVFVRKMNRMYGDRFHIDDRMDMRSQNLPLGNCYLMPHRIAIALQEDGWIVRNDNVWRKLNPMPESINGWRWQRKSCDCGKEIREAIIKKQMKMGVPRHRVYEKAGTWKADPNCEKCGGTGKLEEWVLIKGSWRHTKSHEFIFQLSKKMNYYGNRYIFKGPNPRSVINIPSENSEAFYEWMRDRTGLELYELIDQFLFESSNPESIIETSPEPYSGKHFAIFPPLLIAPLIRACCPKRTCPECGTAWAPMIDRTELPFDDTRTPGEHTPTSKTKLSGSVLQKWLEENPPKIVGYKAVCDCGREDHIPGIVLDPFIGSGTTGMVARQLGRRWIGLDIAFEYLEKQAKPRALGLTPKGALDDLPLFKEMNNGDSID